MKQHMQIHVFLNHYRMRRYVGILEERAGNIYFEYDRDFLASGIPLSPFRLPLQPGVITGPQEPFWGLFGVFNDSLPDGWGMLLLDRLLRKQGIPASGITPPRRLLLVGTGGMGALEYEPALPPLDCEATPLNLDGIAAETWRILNEQPLPIEALHKLLCLNGSSCGARPKIVVKVSKDRTRLFPDSVEDETLESWIVKFPSRFDAPDIGRTEYAFSVAARKAGICMPETCLFQGEGEAVYFGARRFDRESGAKVHMHTASGLLHASHRYGSLDYENLLKLTKILTGDIRDVTMLARLMIFNVKSGNRDDHAKNFSFLLSEEGRWRLAPAYDLTPSRGVMGEQTCMINGKGSAIQDDDLMAAASTVDIAPVVIREMIEEVETALAETIEAESEEVSACSPS